MKPLGIGLLGGSFNPAHEGHLYISETALRSLGLDQVWWLVSPQNPLKSEAGMAPFETRVASAKALARNPRIKISEFEKQAGETYTAQTLKLLKHTHPNYNFVWLMGADNLIQVSNWYMWQEIFSTVPVAVFDRPGYTYPALASKAAQIYRKNRIFPGVNGTPVENFAHQQPPAWTFVTHTKHKLSSTSLRNPPDT